MIKLQQLIGLPVVDLHTGKQAGKVKDALFDEHWSMQGIIVDAGKWLHPKDAIVQWDKVTSCGTEAVMIDGMDSVMPREKKAAGRCFQIGQVKLRDMPVVTVQGSQLGRVSDVYFEPIQGTQIVGYELTDGFISDLLEGRKWLRTPEAFDTVKLGEDAIIVPAYCEMQLLPVAPSDSNIGRNER
ncbi:PRC-barrel domain protein [Paenibacillus curdlanolyticus YK9]|uniref:PRC-barrel domain protein n=1 Tax=Paenibacillus curdlanolyticus YK9 TaxID=717606 RepID=E0IE01_9BACL|nr:PRC-barrel domain-containing protein [Paenibacillus curdlanolyticus]EFM09355.1 PRC-barrel domain protein [Paenibacillus curdlanolyticus YK9]